VGNLKWHVPCSVMGPNMPPFARSALFTTLTGVMLTPCAALAQTTSTGPSITQAQQTAPERFLHYGQANQTDLGTQTRSNGLNPTGINYSDCISDMTLGFPVILNGFGTGNTDGMQIWASVTGTCTTDADRGVGQVPLCWLVSEGLPLGQVFTGSTEYFIRVQDIVGSQQAPPNPPVLVHQGADACTAQPSYAAVTITLWFVPLSGEGTYDTSATALQWALNTDLVGPPAPLGLTVGAGETLLIASWTPNTDSDTYGYDVFIDPPPGSLAQTTTAVTQVVCPSASSSSSTAGSSTDASSATAQDAAQDATEESGEEGADANDATTSTSSSSSASSSTTSTSSSTSADAACFTVNVAQGGQSIGSCTSSVLGSAVVQDSGTTAVEGDSGEDAALEEQATDSGTTTGIGGIATIPCQYALDVGCASGTPIYTGQQVTVTGETNTRFNISGLVDQQTYAVAVSAVDNSGNPGPPSTPTCNYPAPVNDFFTDYRSAGGLAGGGFCALNGGGTLGASGDSPVGSSIVLAAVGTAALAAARRGRRRK